MNDFCFMDINGNECNNICREPSPVLNLKKLADEGSAVAQFDIANYLEKKESVLDQEALHYYKLSADQDYGPALIAMANYYVSDEINDKNQAFEYYKRAAAQGYAEAQFNVGVHYEFGYSAEKDSLKAVYYYKLAADQGYGEALLYLAICYEKGIGVPKSPEEAFKYYKKAADQLYPPGQYQVARCYRYGIGVKKSLEKSIKYYQLALDQNYKKEKLLIEIEDLKKFYQENKEERKGLNVVLRKLTKHYERQTFKQCLLATKGKGSFVLSNMEKKIEDKEPRGRYGWLADYYLRGKGCKRSDKKAIKYYKLGAKDGNYYCQCELGLLYEKGFVIKGGSIEKALKYYRLAADQGDKIAQLYLAELLYKTSGKLTQEVLKYYKLSSDQKHAPATRQLALHYFEEKRYEDAIKYFKLGSKQECPICKCRLGLCYENGIGVEKSIEKAIEFYELAGNQGDSDALCSIGNLYRLGKDVEYSEEEFLKYYKLAASQGYRKAIMTLADYYYFQVKNDSEAFKYYKIVADEGAAEKGEQQRAQYNIGILYQNGRGTNQSFDQALKYFKLSADRHCIPAIIALANCYFEGKGVEQSYERAVVYFELGAVVEECSVCFRQLGMCYEYGMGVGKSSDRALLCYEHAVKRQDGIAQCYIENLHKFNKGSFKYYHGDPAIYNRLEVFANIGIKILNELRKHQEYLALQKTECEKYPESADEYLEIAKKSEEMFFLLLEEEKSEAIEHINFWEDCILSYQKRLPIDWDKTGCETKDLDAVSVDMQVLLESLSRYKKSLLLYKEKETMSIRELENLLNLGKDLDMLMQDVTQMVFMTEKLKKHSITDLVWPYVK